MDGAGSVKSLRSTVAREARGLKKAANVVKNLLDALEDGANGSSTDDQGKLRVALQTLTDVKKDFKEALVKFEQKASEIDDTTYDQEIEDWGDQDFDSQSLVNLARDKLASVANPDDLRRTSLGGTQSTSSAGPESLVNNDQFSRLLTLLETQQSGRQGAGGSVASSARLPKLELPKFSGEPLKWKNFWDRFEASVGQNGQIAAVDKLNYLMGQVEKEPYLMICSLPITNASYDVAVSLLKSKYEDPKMNIALLYRQLSDIKPVKNDAAALSRFVSEIDCVLGSLTALGQNTSDDNFVTIIMSKLPQTVVYILEMTKPVSDSWSVSLVREKLSEYLIRVDRAGRTSASGKGVNESIDFTGDSLLAGDSGEAHEKENGGGKTGKKGSRKCAFCKGQHFSDRCRKYPDHDSRLKQAKGRCFVCLGSDHMKSKCTSSEACYFCKKVKSHHSSLCRDKFGARKAPPENANLADEKEVEENGTNLLAAGEQTLLQTAQVRISDSKQCEHVEVVRILLDPGSNRTYCSEKLAKKLSLQLLTGPRLRINRFGTDEPVVLNTKVARVFLNKTGGSLAEVEACVVERITGDLTRAPVDPKMVLRVAKGIKLADTLPKTHEVGPIEFLIGSDHYLDFIRGQKIEVSAGLHLLNSEFGWILSGRTKQKSGSGFATSVCGLAFGLAENLEDSISIMPPVDQCLRSKVQVGDLYALETLGIRDDPSESDDRKAEIDFARNVQFKNGRYSVSLPFNDRKSELGDDYKLSLGRLKSVTKRLADNPDLMGQYADIMAKQLDIGVIEKVESLKGTGHEVHYLPHHAVVKPEKETTKVRVVFDGSASTKKWQPGLNDCLFRGPVLLEDLAGLIMRFREHPVAILADIEKAFLQIEIRDQDRDYLRFIWLKDPKTPLLEDNLQEFRFARVPFGTNCSPSLLGQTVRYHLGSEGSETARKILANLYCDNVVTGVNSEKEALEFYQQSKEIFDRASMNLRSWFSNCKKFVEQIPDVDRSNPTKVKVLGVNWDVNKDTFSVEAPGPEKLQQVGTKSEMLGCIASIFDPLGFTSPCSIQAKCILQEACTGNTKWKTPLPKYLLQKWEAQVPTLSKVREVAIPRLIPCSGKLSLIAFSDASASSYAMTIYLRSHTTNRIDVRLLMAKSRVNPAKKLSIPKAELMGSLIGARGIKFATHHLHLPITEWYLFCDSQIVLCWLKQGRPQEIFVRNRIIEIQKVPNLECRYVQSEQNPADWGTRGKSPDQLTQFWWEGPSWLSKPKDKWPTWDFAPFRPNLVEKRTSQEITMATDAQVECPMGLNLARFPTLTKLLRVTGLCLRFVKKIRKQSQEKGLLKAMELQDAKKIWESYVQKKAYDKIFTALKKGHSHEMAHLGVFLDSDGLLRIRGRLGKMECDFERKFPKLMPKSDQYTQLLVQAAHAKCGHGAVNHTLVQLRSEYWIPKGRSVVQQVLKKCVTCRKAAGNAYGMPKMPELPFARVNPHACFTCTGVDYFGPLKVRQDSKTSKCWVALFTCLATRAIHLELVMDLSATEFIMALKRFTSRRGQPANMVSDNAPQFKLVARATELAWRKVLTDDAVTNFCANSGINWTFIPAYAPYAGGVYERMVGIAKTCLRKTVGQALLSVKQLETILCECEATVNSRPLVYVGAGNPSDNVITPSHFLSLNPKVMTADKISKLDGDRISLQGSTAAELIQEWKKGQRLLNEFWKVWSSEYLNVLRERSHYAHKHSSRSPEKPAVGHVILLKVQGIPRGSWKIARISQLHESADGEIRSVSLKLPSGRELRRPIHLLIPLETSQARNGLSEIGDEPEEDEDEPEL